MNKQRARHVLTKRPPTAIGWFTTAPHPWKKAHTHGADQNQVGWHLHAVPVTEEGNPEKRARLHQARRTAKDRWQPTQPCRRAILLGKGSTSTTTK